MATNEAQQCKAITADGSRCTRRAQEDGFCHQHGPDDETVEDEDVSGGTSSDGSGDAAAGAVEIPDDVDFDDFEQIADQVHVVTDAILGRPLDTISGINRVDEGWAVTVQVIERKSIPDTQDILGQYEVTFDESISPVGYERTARYRRDQMQQQL